MISPEEVMGCNLTLEVLRGCDYYCSDCTVDKGAETLDISDEDTKDILSLIDDFDERFYKKLEFTIGPTDFISADNGLSSLDHPLIKGLNERYISMVIPLVMLNDRGLDTLAAKLEESMPGGNVVINVPVTLKNMRNDKYRAMLDKRILYFKGMLRTVKLHHVNLNVNVMLGNAERITADEDRYLQGLQFSAKTAIEYAFGHSRKGLNNILTTEELKRDIALYSAAVRGLADTKLNKFLVPRTYDAIELVFRNSKLYYLPIVFERFPMFIPEFEIPKPWTADKVAEFKEKVVTDNLIYFSENKVCSNCCFLPNCARGDVQTMTRMLSFDNCLIGMKNRWDLDPFSYVYGRDSDNELE